MGVNLYKILLTNLCISILIFGNIPVASQTEESTLNKIHDVYYSGGLSKSFDINQTIKPTYPNISDFTQNNLSDLSVSSAVTYAHDDYLNIKKFTIIVEIIKIIIIDDKDGFGQGGGDIFLEGNVNGNFTRYPDTGTLEINDNENKTINAFVLNSSASSLNSNFEVREEDPGLPDESLGFVKIYRSNPVNETIDVSSTTGDARLLINITSIEEVNNLSAGEFITGYRPYLYVDDEVGDELPKLVAGRLSRGNDSGIDAYVLQYYFYWDNEKSPSFGGFSPFEFHQNDFEALLVYFDASNLTSPYRIVFNNWQYSSALSEFPAEDILILEKGADDKNIDYTNSISPQLQTILGPVANQSANVKPITDMNDWSYTLGFSKDTEISSMLGYYTFELVVDTSYHTFDLGPGGTEFGFNYTVQSLNQSLLQLWYGEIVNTFENGTHFWSTFGIDVPKVAPFSHDVTQLFNAPYIISTYSSIAQSAGALSRAKNENIIIQQKLRLGVNFNYPAELSILYPKTISTGTSKDIIMEFTPKSNDFTIGFSYDFSLHADLAYWFAQANFTYENNGSIEVNVPLEDISGIFEMLGMDEFELVSDVSMTDYLTFDTLTIYPNLFGTILEGAVSLNLWEVLSNVNIHPVVTILVRLIDFFIDGVNLVFNPQVEGVIVSNITTPNSGVSISEKLLKFRDEESTITRKVSVEEDANIDDGVTIEIDDLFYALDFFVDWLISIEFKKPLSSLVDGFEWVIGTYPTYTEELISSSGTTIIIPKGESEEDDPGDIISGLIIFLVIAVIAGFFYRNSRKKSRRGGPPPQGPSYQGPSTQRQAYQPPQQPSPQQPPESSSDVSKFCMKCGTTRAHKLEQFCNACGEKF